MSVTVSPQGPHGVLAVLLSSVPVTEVDKQEMVKNLTDEFMSVL